MKALVPTLALMLVTVPVWAAVVNDPNLVVETVTTDLFTPSAVAFIGDDDLLVLQQFDGQVRRIVGGTLLPDPVLDLPVDIERFDRGLLGIALDPDFQNNGFAYLFYAEADVDGGTPLGARVTRFRWDGAALVEPSVLLSLPVFTNQFRIGGIVLFGADDLLYAVMGDQQRHGKLQNNPAGADPNDTSAIFRINTDGTAPSNNPFAGSTGPLAPMNRYFAYGLRNSFGMAIDPVTGALWETENGQGVYDEINLVDPGLNSGWEKIQGPDARDPEGVGDLWMAPGASYSDPEFSWLDPVAPTTIAFIQNPKLGCSKLHDLLVASSNCFTLDHFELNAPRTGLTFTAPELADLVADNDSDQCGEEQSELAFGSDFGIVTDVETGPDGNLYVVSIDLGILFRIVPNRDVSVDADSDGVEDTCDCNPVVAGAWSAPGEVPRIRLSGKSPTRLGWNDQRAAIGSSTVYDVVAGRLSDLRSSGFSLACTLANGIGPNLLSDTRSNPDSGDGFYYLVRAANACMTGTFGNANTVPDPRDALDASLPSACP